MSKISVLVDALLLPEGGDQQNVKTTTLTSQINEPRLTQFTDCPHHSYSRNVWKTTRAYITGEVWYWPNDKPNIILLIIPACVKSHGGTTATLVYKEFPNLFSNFFAILVLCN